MSGSATPSLRERLSNDAPAARRRVDFGCYETGAGDQHVAQSAVGARRQTVELDQFEDGLCVVGGIGGGPILVTPKRRPLSVIPAR